MHSLSIGFFFRYRPRGAVGSGPAGVESAAVSAVAWSCGPGVFTASWEVRGVLYRGGVIKLPQGSPIRLPRRSPLPHAPNAQSRRSLGTT